MKHFVNRIDFLAWNLMFWLHSYELQISAVLYCVSTSTRFAVLLPPPRTQSFAATTAWCSKMNDCSTLQNPSFVITLRDQTTTMLHQRTAEQQFLEGDPSSRMSLLCEEQTNGGKLNTTNRQRGGIEEEKKEAETSAENRNECSHFPGPSSSICHSRTIWF